MRQGHGRSWCCCPHCWPRFYPCVNLRRWWARGKKCHQVFHRCCRLLPLAQRRRISSIKKYVRSRRSRCTIVQESGGKVFPKGGPTINSPYAVAELSKGIAGELPFAQHSSKSRIRPSPLNVTCGSGRKGYSSLFTMSLRSWEEAKLHKIRGAIRTDAKGMAHNWKRRAEVDMSLSTALKVIYRLDVGSPHYLCSHWTTTGTELSPVLSILRSRVREAGHQDCTSASRKRARCRLFGCGRWNYSAHTGNVWYMLLVRLCCSERNKRIGDLNLLVSRESDEWYGAKRHRGVDWGLRYDNAVSNLMRAEHDLAGIVQYPNSFLSSASDIFEGLVSCKVPYLCVLCSVRQSARVWITELWASDRILRMFWFIADRRRQHHRANPTKASEVKPVPSLRLAKTRWLHQNLQRAHTFSMHEPSTTRT